MMLLQFLEAPSERRQRSARGIREFLARSKVFGLPDPERWPGSKGLVDFIDDLFSARRRSMIKLEKPVSDTSRQAIVVANSLQHEYITKGVPPSTVLVPMLELASLECFPLWQPIAAPA